MIAEWRKGCCVSIFVGCQNMTLSNNPEDCRECTVHLIEAIERWHIEMEKKNAD
jgi:hypothetical protein